MRVPTTYRPDTYPDYVEWKRCRELGIDSFPDLSAEDLHATQAAAAQGDVKAQMRLANLKNSEELSQLLPTSTIGTGGKAGKAMKNFEATGEVMESFDAKKVMETIREAGVAGLVSYGVVQLGFFGLAIPAGLYGYYQLTGHWPDLSNAEDQAQLTGEALAFLGFSRLLIPLRIALALGLTQGVQTNIIDRFQKATKPLQLCRQL